MGPEALFAAAICLRWHEAWSTKNRALGFLSDFYGAYFGEDSNRRDNFLATPLGIRTGCKDPEHALITPDTNGRASRDAPPLVPPGYHYYLMISRSLVGPFESGKDGHG